MRRTEYVLEIKSDEGLSHYNDIKSIDCYESAILVKDTHGNATYFDIREVQFVKLYALRIER